VRLEAWRLPLFIALLLAPLPWLVLAIGARLGGPRRSRAAATASVARPVTPRVAGEDDGDHARYTRRTLLGALAQRLNVSPQELVSRRDVERTVRRRGVTRDTTKALLVLLDALAVQGFSEVPTAVAARDDLTARADALLAAGKVPIGIGANSVVITDVPADATVVGNPGHVVRVDGRKPVGPDADWIHLPDPVADAIKRLSERIEALDARVAELSGDEAEPAPVRPLRSVRGPNPAGG
jgi:hypothetical protein